jgi:hypothetical protein
MIFHYLNKFGNVRVTSPLITSESLKPAGKNVLDIRLFISKTFTGILSILFDKQISINVGDTCRQHGQGAGEMGRV